LFGVTSCSNVFIRQRHLAGNRLRQDYWQRRDGKAPNVRLSLLDSHAVMLLFLCPRPVALVTTQREKYMNMFPVNLMGEIGKDMFTLALNSERRAADCVHLAEHIAVSYMPFEMAGLVRQLGANHYKTSIDIGQLPFLTRSSERLGLPVPANATRVLEMRVKASSRLGSHRLFVSDIISDARAGDSPQLCMVHGLYDVAIEAAKNKSS
jgi:flavin reductase (DIM6/NTAB) family NADH-FMN oxidoreductase RutF